MFYIIILQHCGSPTDTCAIVQHFLSTSQQHAQNGFLNVLVAVYGRRQRATENLEYVLQESQRHA